MNDEIIKLLISLFLIIPILNLIHLLGIAFFGIVFGGKIDKFSIGTGKMLLHIGTFEIRNSYPIGGECIIRGFKTNNIYKRVVFALSGVIFVFITGIVLAMLMLAGIIKRDIILINTVLFSFLLVAKNLIPTNAMSGWGATGRRVLDIIGSNHLDELAKDEKTLPQFINEVDSKIKTLRDECIVYPYDYVRLRYMTMLQYKALKVYDLGRVDEALKILESVEMELISNIPALMILYYNDILFKSVESERFENIDELYNKLTSLLAIEENKKYFSNSVKDTIATYEYYRGDKEKSEKLFKEVLESESYSSKFTGGLYHLSKIYFEKGQYSEAKKIINYIDMKDVYNALREKVDNLRNILASTYENKQYN